MYTMKRLALATAVVTLIPGMAATAPDDESDVFDVSYVNSFVEAHGSLQFWTGTGGGTVVGDSTIANTIRDKANAKRPVGF